MVFISKDNAIVCTTTSMYYYLYDKLNEIAKIEDNASRIKEVHTLFNVTVANIEEHEVTMDEEGMNIFVNGKQSYMCVISKEAIEQDDDLLDTFEHCQELIRAKHTKWLEDTFDREVTANELPVYSIKKETKVDKDFAEGNNINYHQMAIVSMFGIIFNIDKDNCIAAGKCVEIDTKYIYNLESFRCFLDFLQPFVCEDNPITESSFDILTFNYCNLYNELQEDTHKLVEDLVLTLVKSNYKN